MEVGLLWYSATVACGSHVDVGDLVLIRTLDEAMAEVSRKSGSWLACRPGCTQCCIGPFPIHRLDVRRLRRGMRELEERDPARARGVRERARESVARIAAEFPGDAASGILGEGEADAARFESFADDEPCPALDPENGTCDVYAFRPMTCRVFGPPVRDDSGVLGICELCFEGATEEEIAACELTVDPEGREAALMEELEQGGERGRTIVAFALAGQAPV
jgi:Fe-S-cluster containining protein